MNAEQPKPTTPKQKKLLEKFYGIPNTQVVYAKKERKAIEKPFNKTRTQPPASVLARCPAMWAEFQKSMVNKKNIQPAVFSECSYAQTLANMLELSIFFAMSDIPAHLLEQIGNRLSELKIKARYFYFAEDFSSVLVQAGGNASTDAALIDLRENKVFLIEFKEQAAKTTEADLKSGYNEMGHFAITDTMVADYPQFEKMINEQLNKGLNFYDHDGTNVRNFDAVGVKYAITHNYEYSKPADVICVEDRDGYLVMMPANHAAKFATKVEGEIRPAGRNISKVWTPQDLRSVIEGKNGEISGAEIVMPLASFKTAKSRNGNDDVSRYKINSRYFVRAENVKIVSGKCYFSWEDVGQLTPTISAKMFFSKLTIDDVRAHYLPEV
jgi:hypothetical protein